MTRRRLMAPGPFRRVDCVALSVLVAAISMGCYLPTPQCAAEHSRPQAEMLLMLALVRNTPHIASLNVDTIGRSDLIPKHTAWALRAGRVCRTLPAQDLHALEVAWGAVVASHPNDSWPAPPRPFLLVTYRTAAGERQYFVQPEQAAHRPEIEDSVRVTLRVLERAYGERFVAELEAAGLAGLR